MNYDYIITGSGCAGLSLLYSILKDPLLCTKNILVIDKSEKTTNDRTWCYWEKGQGAFEPIVAHRWKKLEFKTSTFTKRFDLEQYSYKMIRGIDFYQHVLEFANDYKNVTFKFENVEKIETAKGKAIVKTAIGEYTATYVFNSTGLFNPTINTTNSLLQHFEGWVIKTKNATCNGEVGTLMDFSVSQKYGTTFMYVLPTSAYEALIEHTLFTPTLLGKEEYKIELEKYIKNDLKIEEYELLHEEFGVIPMSFAKFSRNPNAEERIINIGTAGGFTKASSGYTFQFIQKNTAKIVENLRNGRLPTPKITIGEKVYQWYDNTLLEVLITKKMTGKEIFSRMLPAVFTATTVKL